MDYRDLSVLRILLSDVFITESGYDSVDETVGADVVVIELFSCLPVEKRFKTESNAAPANLPSETVLIGGISKQ